MLVLVLLLLLVLLVLLALLVLLVLLAAGSLLAAGCWCCWLLAAVASCPLATASCNPITCNDPAVGVAAGTAAVLEAAAAVGVAAAAAARMRSGRRRCARSC